MNVMGSTIQEASKTREKCDIPWGIPLAPTSACNMHCTGCRAAALPAEIRNNRDGL